MPVQINIINVKINALDKAFANIGPSVKHVLRCRSRYNFGYGEVTGYKNHVTVERTSITDNDLLDHTIKKVIIHRGPGGSV